MPGQQFLCLHEYQNIFTSKYKNFWIIIYVILRNNIMQIRSSIYTKLQYLEILSNHPVVFLNILILVDLKYILNIYIIC